MDASPAPEAAWRVSEWDAELWIETVALLNQMLTKAGGQPVTLASAWDRMPPHAKAFVEKVSTVYHYGLRCMTEGIGLSRDSGTMVNHHCNAFAYVALFSVLYNVLH